jgi:uncharacterized protein YceK
MRRVIFLLLVVTVFLAGCGAVQNADNNREKQAANAAKQAGDE